MTPDPYAEDLFGNVMPEQSTEQTYLEYINSLAWKRRAETAKAKAGHRCQRCGFSKYSRPLTVHHLNYDNLGHEKDNDLQVLCPPCHKEADEERVQAATAKRTHKRYHGALAAGFDGWMSRSSAGESWYSNLGRGEIQAQWERFVEYINQSRKSEIKPGTCPFLD
jgi:hypothetical protein